MKIINCDIDRSSFKLSVLFVVVFLSFVLIVSNNQRKMFINSHKENLQILANEKSELVDIYFKSEEVNLSVVAAMSDFVNVLQYPDDAVMVEIAKKRINELSRIIPNISIMNSAGKVIVGDIDLPGTDYSSHPYFLAKREDIAFTRYHDPRRNKDYYAVIGPIYNFSKTKIIGRAAYDISTDIINSLLINKEKDTDHNHIIYFVDGQGLLLGSSDYSKSKEKTSLGQIVQTDAVKKCLSDLEEYKKDGKVQEHIEDILQYKNYKGENVFGAHDFVSRVDGCVIAEESADIVLQFSIIDAFGKIFNPFLPSI